MSESTQENIEIADAKKKAGNEAFAAKNYERAIKLYSEAIELDSSNHLFFSNRSACYAAKRDWTSAAEDAKKIIELSPSFVKGYYRLGLAQMEMGEFGPAAATVRKGLELDNGSSDLQKLLRLIKARKAQAAGKRGESGMTRQQKMDEATRKEILELQEEMQKTQNELRQAGLRLNHCRKDLRRTTLTFSNLEQTPHLTTAYRAIGKMFLRCERPEVMTYLEQQTEKGKDMETKILGQQAYLERRLKSQQANYEDLVENSNT
uniref:Hsp70-Hsp90 organising protein n=1 Tax=Fibrocapsa japonica TaxID=94617 RepID=A0A6U1NHW5_9STRA|mmetsp:Transcript_21131/g.30652  ORF Transcript_21131/g.30652 Transcript_21131/m.30652 type:complete len:262 (+) Transcript_21131:55-840(+)